MPLESGKQARIAPFQVDVGGAGVEVHCAHRVTGDCVGLADGLVILVIARTKDARSNQTMPALVDEAGGEVEIAPFAGLSVQLDQRQLDFFVAVDAGPSARTEFTIEQVGKTHGCLQQSPVASGARKSDAGLDEMAGAIHLAAARQVGQLPFRLDDLEPRIQITVVLLSAEHEVDDRTERFF